MVAPRCPHCNAPELTLTSQYIAQFNLIFCADCGAVFNVFPLSTESPLEKHEPAPPVTSPQRHRAIPAQFKDLTAYELTHVLARLTGQLDIRLTSTQIEQMFTQLDTVKDPPDCNNHKTGMVLLTVPFGFSRAGQLFWMCQFYHSCQQWQIASPPPYSPPPAPFTLPKVESATPSPQIASKEPASLLDIIGSADLSHKQPYNPEAIANRMKAAGMGRGTRYLQIAIDAGPPLCPKHKAEMVKITIPIGYPNTGRKVWLCSQFKDCRQWELAE